MNTLGALLSQSTEPDYSLVAVHQQNKLFYFHQEDFEAGFQHGYSQRLYRGK